MLVQAKKIGFAAAVFAAMTVMTMSTAVQAKENPSDEVAAIVNGEKILKKDVLGALKSMNVEEKETEKAFPFMVNQIVNEKLIDIETTKANIEKDPAFEIRKAQLIKTMYLEKYLKDKVSDQAVKAEYEKFKKMNKGKQEVHAHHILVATEEEAKQVIKTLDGGAKFEDLAKERSSGPTAKSGGDVGFFAKGEIVPEFSDAAFKLKPGTYTKSPVKSQFGWHVIYVDEKRERSVPDLNKDIESQIRQKLGQDALESLVKSLRAKADIQRFGMDGKPMQDEVKNN